MMAAIPTKRALWRRLAVAALLVSAILLVGMMLMLWIGATSIESVTASLDRARPLLTLWRLALFALVIGYWPRWVGWIAKKKQWSAAQRDYWLAVRGRIAIWWLAIELLVMQNALGLIFRWLA